MIVMRSLGDVTQIIMGRLINGKPFYTMSCYLVDGLLIDTGPFHVAVEIEQAFASYPVRQIVNTHHHEDHISNNIVFQEKLGIGPALAHELAVPLIKNPEIWTSRLRHYQHLAWGVPPASDAVVIGPEVTTERFRFQVLHIPGHSDDHIALLEPEKGWLFSGDLFISEKLSTLRSDENANEILDSMHMLLQREFSTLFCASGRVVKNAHRAIEAKILYWEDLKKQVLNLHHQGVSPEQIREQLLGEESSLYGPSEGDFGKINLIKSLLA
ncbi:MAG: MBL fold metallo-hydrolase [Syntrophomonadaceae bacterium]